MPIALKPVAIENQFDGCASVLIVPCQVCPKMCLAAESGRPFIGMTAGDGNDPLAAHITAMRETLGAKGIRTSVFRPPATSPMMCLWPARVRESLAKESEKHDALAVIGCESATATAESAAGKSGKAVIQVMKNEGMANFIAKFSFPCSVELAPGPRGTIPWPGQPTGGTSATE